jgi:hypothetical protein
MDPGGSNGKRRKADRQKRSPAALAALAGEGRRELHSLSNTLASMRLRLAMLAADPSCQETQGENLAALLVIADDAIRIARRLQPALEDIQILTKERNGVSRRPRGPSNGR